MRSIIADIFRFLFRFSFFRKRFFGIHSRFFYPRRVFRGVRKRIRLSNGILLDLDISDWVQENLFFLGEYEAAEIGFMVNTMRPGDVFMDIGANIGLFTLYASKTIGETGRVYAFEPLKENFNSLSTNVKINNAGNVVLENKGISDETGEMEIFYDENQANLGMASAHLSVYSHSETCPVISLDQFLENNPVEKVDFIKIDVEGGEYQALLGMKNTLSKHHPVLLIEINEEVLSGTAHSEQDILDLLKKLGYGKQPISDDKTCRNFAFIKG